MDFKTGHAISAVIRHVNIPFKVVGFPLFI